MPKSELSYSKHIPLVSKGERSKAKERSMALDQIKRTGAKTEADAPIFIPKAKERSKENAKIDELSGLQQHMDQLHKVKMMDDSLQKWEGPMYNKWDRDSNSNFKH